MHLLVKPDGTRCWRLKFPYRRGLIPLTVDLGIYPKLSLVAARRLADAARRHWMFADGD
jgi:Arm DNA-binding domain